MERASFAVASRVAQILSENVGRVVGSKVLLLVGSGDNGADALFAGSYLRKRGVDVRALLITQPVDQLATNAFIDSSGTFLNQGDAETFDADLILDGIVGSGLQGALRNECNSAVELANQSHALVVAIDLPSGVIADTGEVQGIAIEADVTLTIGAYKIGTLTGAGKSYVGTLDLINIGIEYPTDDAVAGLIDIEEIAEIFPDPESEAHKYSHGVVGLDVGSSDFPGAALLATAGALASGVGMVRIAGDVATDVIERYPEVVIGLHDAKITGFAVGSGKSGTLETLIELLASPHPVVIDAHALQFLSELEILQLTKRRLESSVLTVITPHEGEAARLGFASKDRVSMARQMANQLNVTTVLKGPGTVIAEPAGSTFIDTYGSSALATAGTGDVLAGLLAGTLARVPNGTIKTVAGAVALHGLASRLMNPGDSASDLVRCLAQARIQL